MARHVVVFVTAGSAGEAQKIAGLLLEKRLAACVNIIPAVSSHFRWQGKIDSAEESMLVVKTRASLLEDVVKSVAEAHSYEVPEVLALPVLGGNPAYLDWLDRETGGG